MQMLRPAVSPREELDDRLACLWRLAASARAEAARAAPGEGVDDLLSIAAHCLDTARARLGRQHGGL